MKKAAFLILLLFNVYQASAQYGFAIDGYIKDSITGNAVTGARVSIDKGGIETFTNRYGYYSISVPAEKMILSVDYQGFVSIHTHLQIIENQSLNFNLKTNWLYNLSYFEASTSSQNVLSDPQSSKIDVSTGTLKQIPYLFSENDVVKGLQMFPGIDFGSDGTSDLFIRGGETGQNLMLLDGTPIYSQGHMFGYISNFNTALVNNIQVYKGAFPARYGGRISSVIDVTTNSGDADGVQGSLTISPFLANLNFSMPVDKRGSTFSFAGRRSYIDILFGTAFIDALKFGDFQTKLNIQATEKDLISLSFYRLNDDISITLDESDSATSVIYTFGLKDINNTATLRWNRNYNTRLFSSISGSYSGLNHFTNLTEKNLTPLPGNPTKVKNDVRFYMGDLALNGDFEYNASNIHFLRYGIQNTMHMFVPGNLTEQKFDNLNALISKEQYGDSVVKTAIESAIYIEDERNLRPNLKINAGLRGVLYVHKDLVSYFLEPRLTGRYKIDSISSLKFAFMRVNQFVHLYNNGSTAQENIVWIPADDVLKPQNSNQFNLSYARKIKANTEWQSDAYVKTMNNQILFYSIDYFDTEAFARNALIGKGLTYGIENFIKHSFNEFSIWASYDLSVAKRTFEDLNKGQSFFFDYDRRHKVKSSFVMNLDQFICSMNMVWASGNPFTLPNAKYRDIDGRLILSYDQINNYRAKAYFRTDIKIQYFWGESVEFNHSLELTIYNLTASKNVSNIFSELDTDEPNQKYKAIKESNFLFFPSISYKLTL